MVEALATFFCKKTAANISGDDDGLKSYCVSSLNGTLDPVVMGISNLIVPGVHPKASSHSSDVLDPGARNDYPDLGVWCATVKIILPSITRREYIANLPGKMSVTVDPAVGVSTG